MIYVLSGPVRRGKTTLLKKISRRATKQGVSIGGFLSESVEQDGIVAGYDLFDLRRETRVPFLRRQGEAGWQKTGPYFMIPEILDEASALIRRAEPGRLLIVDEVGPLELGGAGLWPALAETIFREDVRSLLVIRQACLDGFLRKPGASGARVFSVRDPGAEEALFKEVLVGGQRPGGSAEDGAGTSRLKFAPEGSEPGGRFPSHEN